MILYPFQREAKEAVLRHWEGGHTAALVSLPTGAGKTIVFSDILNSSLTTESEKGLVLVHRDELLRQAVEKLRVVWPEARLSTVDAAEKDFTGQVTVASVMALGMRLDEIPQIQTVVTDEAHHAAAGSWLRIYNRIGEIFPAWRHLGVTATPIRNNGAADLEAIFGKPVYVKSIFELIVEGYLSPLKALEVRTEISVENVGVERGDFTAKELSRVINTPERNRLVVESYLEHASERKALVFAADLSHAKSLAETFQTQGVNAAWVAGETPLGLRRSLLENLRSGELKVIVNCMVFTEGFDEPSLDAILIARPTRSLVLYCQMIGRGLRPFPGKKNCLFIDFVDNYSKNRLISLQDLLMFYQTKKTEKNIADLLAKKLARQRQISLGKKGEKSLVIDLSPTNLPLLVNLENLSSSVKEIDLFGLDAFAWFKSGEAHYVQVNDVFSLVLRSNSNGHDLYAVFPKAGWYAPLLKNPVDFNLAYGCGNAYLFDFGDRHLAPKNSRWRSGEPTEAQRDLFRRLRDRVKDMSTGSISFTDPAAKKGEYGAAIAALYSEVVLFSGRQMKSEEAKQFIKENLYARAAEERPVAPSINGNGDAIVEAALKKAIATFSSSKKEDFLGYLGRILSESQIVVHGSCVTVSHKNFPSQMTQRQLKTVKERLLEEIRLYAPDAELDFAQFPIT